MRLERAYPRRVDARSANSRREDASGARRRREDARGANSRRALVVGFHAWPHGTLLAARARARELLRRRCRRVLSMNLASHSQVSATSWLTSSTLPSSSLLIAVVAGGNNEAARLLSHVGIDILRDPTRILCEPYENPSTKLIESYLQTEGCCRKPIGCYRLPTHMTYGKRFLDLATICI